LLTDRHKGIAGKIWEIANRLRGPYRPPQYRLVMLPMVVLRRLDCVLEPTKDAVLAEHARVVAYGAPENAIPRLLTRVVGQDRKQSLYNISPYTFQKLQIQAGVRPLHQGEGLYRHPRAGCLLRYGRGPGPAGSDLHRSGHERRPAGT
jgi:hypothetical protein